MRNWNDCYWLFINVHNVISYMNVDIALYSYIVLIDIIWWYDSWSFLINLNQWLVSPSSVCWCPHSFKPDSDGCLQSKQWNLRNCHKMSQAYVIDCRRLVNTNRLEEFEHLQYICLAGHTAAYAQFPRGNWLLRWSVGWGHCVTLLRSGAMFGGVHTGCAWGTSFRKFRDKPCWTSWTFYNFP